MCLLILLEQLPVLIYTFIGSLFFTNIIPTDCTIATTHNRLLVLNRLSIVWIWGVVIILGGWLIVQVTMTLTFDNNHIIYYLMDAQWLVGLVQTYFAISDYLTVQEWIHAAFLYPHTINPTEPIVYHYSKFYEYKHVVDYKPMGVPCHRLMAVISFANPTLPYVLTANPVLQSIDFTATMSGNFMHPWSYCMCMSYFTNEFYL